MLGPKPDRVADHPGARGDPGVEARGLGAVARRDPGHVAAVAVVVPVAVRRARAGSPARSPRRRPPAPCGWPPCGRRGRGAGRPRRSRRSRCSPRGRRSPVPPARPGARRTPPACPATARTRGGGRDGRPPRRATGRPRAGAAAEPLTTTIGSTFSDCALSPRAARAVRSLARAPPSRTCRIAVPSPSAARWEAGAAAWAGAAASAAAAAAIRAAARLTARGEDAPAQAVDRLERLLRDASQLRRPHGAHRGGAGREPRRRAGGARPGDERAVAALRGAGRGGVGGGRPGASPPPSRRGCRAARACAGAPGGPCPCGSGAA